MEKQKSNKSLKFYRQQINEIDNHLATLLARRFDLARDIGRIKKEEDLSVADNYREEEIIERLIKETGLDERFLRKIYRLIFQESRKKQQKG